MDVSIYKNIEYKKRGTCAVCGQKLERPVVNLPQLPLTEIYTDKKPQKLTGFADQFFHFCENCGHGQLANIIDPEVLYGQNTYFFRTSQSKSAVKANDTFLSFIKGIVKGRNFQYIIEIGCSDLYLLNTLSAYTKQLIGIDPILKGYEEKLVSNKLKIYGDFFENLDLDNEIGSVSLIISSHTLEHVTDPKAMIGRLLGRANKNAVIIFQFPGLETLVTDGRYDQIFHQHLHYFSLPSFSYLLKELGGEIIDYKVNYLHWGSLMIAFRKASQKRRSIKYNAKINSVKIRKGYKDFRLKMETFNDYLSKLRGERLYGFGAALMLPILSYHMQNDFSAFGGILDDDKSKIGSYYINLSIPVISPESISDLHQANIVVTALNTARAILPRVLSFEPKRIIFPMKII